MSSIRWMACLMVGTTLFAQEKGKGNNLIRPLAELPVVPDLVDVFRKPSDLLQVLAETLTIGATTLWLQFGLYDEDIAEKAEDAGLTIVMDRCLKIEHARFHGGLHLAGFNTGVISSRRPR